MPQALIRVAIGQANRYLIAAAGPWRSSPHRHAPLREPSFDEFLRTQQDPRRHPRHLPCLARAQHHRGSCFCAAEAGKAANNAKKRSTVLVIMGRPAISLPRDDIRTVNESRCRSVIRDGVPHCTNLLLATPHSSPGYRETEKWQRTKRPANLLVRLLQRDCGPAS